MSDWEVEFYTARNDTQPVRDYLDGLSPREFGRVRRVLLLLEEFGLQLGMPHVKKLESSDLWELRVRGGVDHRVLYLAIRGRRMLLLHAFAKKQQHTPIREIRTAEQRLRDYRERFPS